MKEHHITILFFIACGLIAGVVGFIQCILMAIDKKTPTSRDITTLVICIIVCIAMAIAVTVIHLQAFDAKCPS